LTQHLASHPTAQRKIYPQRTIPRRSRDGATADALSLVQVVLRAGSARAPGQPGPGDRDTQGPATHPARTWVFLPGAPSARVRLLGMKDTLKRSMATAGRGNGTCGGPGTVGATFSIFCTGNRTERLPRPAGERYQKRWLSAGRQGWQPAYSELESGARVNGDGKVNSSSSEL